MKNPDFPANLINDIKAHMSGTPVSDISFDELPNDFIGTLYYVLYETLTLREADIILMYYNSEETYQSIAEKYSLTKERIREIKNRAVRKLQATKRKRLLFNGIEKTISMNYKNGYNEGVTVTKNEIVATLSGQLHQDVNNIIAALSGQLCQSANANGVPIEDMELSVRAFNCLKRAGINTVEDIIKSGKYGLQSIRNLGKRCYEEIVDILVTKYGQARSDWTLIEEDKKA